mmetsp:Transcript_14343/g.39692  ORF Transcript_14343/g.39692 Transcript_14343/m.39692 type:complete len:257 (-) Transcript_14343:389-1159(-)
MLHHCVHPLLFLCQRAIKVFLGHLRGPCRARPQSRMPGHLIQNSGLQAEQRWHVLQGVHVLLHSKHRQLEVFLAHSVSVAEGVDASGDRLEDQAKILPEPMAGMSQRQRILLDSPLHDLIAVLPLRSHIFESQAVVPHQAHNELPIVLQFWMVEQLGRHVQNGTHSNTHGSQGRVLLEIWSCKLQGILAMASHCGQNEFCISAQLRTDKLECVLASLHCQKSNVTVSLQTRRCKPQSCAIRSHRTQHDIIVCAQLV